MIRVTIVGLSRGNGGDRLTATFSKGIQRTHSMSAEQRETYKYNENAKLEKLFGPEWHDKRKPAAVMIHELDQKRPGLKDFVRARGDNALLVAKLIQAATNYHARKGR